MVVKNRLGLLRQGGGAQVIVLGLKSQTGVPDAASYAVSGKAGGFQFLDAVVYIIR
jgi:hypothetical protein